MDISVVIPVFNERDNLRPLMEELDSVLEPLGKDYEVILVDDGSRDGSAQVITEIVSEQPRAKAVLLRRNSGQTAALDAGLRRVSGKVVVTLDADLQNDPADIPMMLRKLDEGYDMVVGWRRRRRDGLFLRRIPSVTANAIIRRACGTELHDLGCALKVFRREVAKELRLYGEMHRFIGVLADSMGARIAEVEVNHRPRCRGKSKYGLGRTVKVLLDLLTVMFLRGFQTKPLYLFGGTGLLLLVGSVLVAATALWQKLSLGVWVHRNPLFLVAILLAVVGIQFFGIGLVAEVVVRTYFESSDRPTYSIARTLGFEGHEHVRHRRIRANARAG